MTLPNVESPPQSQFSTEVIALFIGTSIVPGNIQKTVEPSILIQYSGYNHAGKDN